MASQETFSAVEETRTSWLAALMDKYKEAEGIQGSQMLASSQVARQWFIRITVEVLHSHRGAHIYPMNTDQHDDSKQDLPEIE